MYRFPTLGKAKDLRARNTSVALTGRPAGQGLAGSPRPPTVLSPERWAWPQNNVVGVGPAMGAEKAW